MEVPELLGTSSSRNVLLQMVVSVDRGEEPTTLAENLLNMQMWSHHHTDVDSSRTCSLNPAVPAVLLLTTAPRFADSAFPAGASGTAGLRLDSWRQRDTLRGALASCCWRVT